MDFSKLFPNLKKISEKDLKDKEKSLSVGDHVSVVKNIRCKQAGKSGVITKINPEDKHGWKSFVVKFDDSKYGSMAFQSGDLNKTVKTAQAYDKNIVTKVSAKRNTDSLIAQAKKHYPETGSHGWNHIQDVMEHARKLKGSELSPDELAAIAYHDSSLMTGARETHAEDSAEIAKRELRKYFRRKKLENIVNAIARHRASYEGKRDTPLEDLVAAADRNSPDAIKDILRSYAYGKEHGWSDDEAIANTLEHIPAKYGRNGYAYKNVPEIYMKAHKDELEDAYSMLDNLTADRIREIVSKQASYEPPYTLDQIRKELGDEVADKLSKDHVHRWRADTGIELIHKEPDLEEFKRIVRNWKLMDAAMKDKSDKKSKELFGKGNTERIKELLGEYGVRSGAKSKDFDDIVRAYKDRYGVDLSHMMMHWSKHPVYNNGKRSYELDDDETGGSWVSDSTIRINPNMGPVMKRFGIGGMTQNEFRRRLIAHELAHEIWKKQHDERRDLIKDMLTKAKSEKFTTPYLPTVPKDKLDEETFAEYMSDQLNKKAEIDWDKWPKYDDFQKERHDKAVELARKIIEEHYKKQHEWGAKTDYGFLGVDDVRNKNRDDVIIRGGKNILRQRRGTCHDLANARMKLLRDAGIDAYRVFNFYGIGQDNTGVLGHSMVLFKGDDGKLHFANPHIGDRKRRLSFGNFDNLDDAIRQYMAAAKDKDLGGEFSDDDYVEIHDTTDMDIPDKIKFRDFLHKALKGKLLYTQGR